MYAQREDKTISHDLNRLRYLGLVTLAGRQGVKPRTALMDAFMPVNHRP